MTAPPRHLLSLLWPIVAAVVIVAASAPLAQRALNATIAPPHFNLLAQALLHGRLDVNGSVYDGVVHNGRTYLPFGPFPSLLLIPAVVFAEPGIPVFWLGLAAVVVATIGLWQMWVPLGIDEISQRTWLTAATIGGTAMLSAVLVNSDYFVAHLVVVACLVWALTLALRGRRPLICGVLVALAGLTRTNALLAAVAVGLLYWDRTHQPRRLALLVAPLVPAVLVLLAYNEVRFGNPLESGYGLQSLLNPELIRLRSQGLFSVVHLPMNLYYLLVAPPLAAGAGAPFPWVRPSPWGMGLIFVSPWLVAALWARGRVAGILAIGLVLTLLPSLLYYGVGWIQFGYRYGLDALPFLVALAAIGYRRRAPAILPGLAVVSMAVNLAGAAWLLAALGG
jgi:hypothetical protein